MNKIKQDEYADEREKRQRWLQAEHEKIKQKKPILSRTYCRHIENSQIITIKLKLCKHRKMFVITQESLTTSFKDELGEPYLNKRQFYSDKLYDDKLEALMAFRDQCNWFINSGYSIGTTVSG